LGARPYPHRRVLGRARAGARRVAFWRKCDKVHGLGWTLLSAVALAHQ
jgi:hypothetical protein